MKISVAIVWAALVTLPGAARAIDSALGKTRFGQLSVEYGGPLLLDGKLLNPEIRGNESLDILRVFRMNKSDVVLVQDNGGSGCPAQMMFVTLSVSGVVGSTEFGTCATEMHIRRSGDSLIITMPLLYGHGHKIYVFRDGVVSEGAKVLK